MLINEQGTGGVDKIRMYGWTLEDRPGEFRMIDKTALVVDVDYQRAVANSDQQVNRIASKWSWIACGTLVVAHRNGAFYVVDGQHRARAALKRSDIDKLPCMVFESPTQKSEAQAFLRVNRDRRAVSPIAAFNARLTAKDPHAIVAQELLEMADLHAKPGGPTSNQFKCIGALLKCVAEDEAVLRRIWPVVVDVAGNKPVHMDILLGMFEVERRMPDGQSLSDRRFANRITASGADEMLRKIRQASAFLGAGGYRARVDGVLAVINHRAINRVELVEQGS